MTRSYASFADLLKAVLEYFGELADPNEELHQQQSWAKAKKEV